MVRIFTSYYSILYIFISENATNSKANSVAVSNLLNVTAR